MVSKYSKEFEVPKDFPSVLKAFSREVLRNQPENIYEFGAEYFATLLAEAAAQEAGTGGTAQERLTPEQLEGLLKDLFKEADTDQSGALSMTECKEVIRLANLGLSDREVGRLLAEADVNQDGEIDYEEFVPIAVDLVQGLYARMESAAEDEVAAVQAQQEAELLIRGMDKAELQKIMMDVFNKADADGSGQLSLAEFQTCIKEAALGLTLLDARWLHPVTAERRTEDRPGDLPPEAVCTHHFVSSWVAHDATMHAATDAARQQGDSRAAVHGVGQPVKTDNDW